MADIERPAVASSHALSGEQFAVLYPGLRRLAAVVADADCDPDDLIQDALVAYLRRFEGTDGAAKPAEYLRTMIVGLAKNHRRSQERRRRREVHHGEPHRFDGYPAEAADLLMSLTPPDRALLTLVDLEGEPISDAARVVGISAVAARARISRARRALRRRLSEDG